MSIVKNKLISIKKTIVKSLSRLRKTVVARWRGLNPGFRYAFVYFVSVVCIASVVWWQFNPGSGLVFVPDTNGDSPPIIQEPEPDNNQAERPGQVPIDNPDHLDQQNGLTHRDWTVFMPQRDVLSLPIEGEVLTQFEQPFAPYESIGNYRLLDGIHIDGTRGDNVMAAWHGVVHKVLSPDPQNFIPGEIWVKHGDWTTVYINLEQINVSQGMQVDKGQTLGTLAPRLLGLYTGDYLEFLLLDPDGAPCDPLEYANTSR